MSIPELPDHENAALRQQIAELEQRLAHHQQTTIALRKSEAQYRLLAEHTADVIWILDLNSMRFTYVSPSVERLRGYTATEALEQPLDQMITPASAAIIHENLPARIQAFLAGDARAATQTHEIEQTRKDGSTVWTEVVTTLLHDAQGLRALGVSREITERKRAEQALRQSNTLLSTVAEIQHSLAATLNEEAIYRILMHGLAQLFPDTGHIFISRFDAARKMIQAVQVLVDNALVDVATLPEFPLAPIGQGLQSQVIHTREPLVIPDKLKSRFQKTRVVRLGADKQETQSAVYVPMLAQDQVLGLIQLQSYVPQRFTPEDVKALGLVANTAAAFIQNARLYALAQTEIAERKRTEQSLNQALDNLRTHQTELQMQNEELTRAHLELDASRAKYFDLYDLAPTGYLTLNSHGIILETNLTAASLIGKARTDLVNQPLSRFILGEDQDAYYSHHRHLATTGTPHTCELRIVRPDGATCWVSITSKAEQADNHTPVFWETLSDITERKQAESALRESETRYRQAIIAADAIPYALDYATHTYTFMGEDIEKLTGYAVQEFTPAVFASMHIQAMMQGKLKNQSVNDAIQLTLAGQGGAMWQCDFLIRTRAGEERWIADSAVQVLGENGLPTGSIGIMQDITARKETEKVLEARVKQATAQIQDLYDNAPTGYHSLDANGNILMINQTELNWLGYTREEILGRPVANLFTPNSLQLFRKIFPVFKQQGRVKDLELEFVRKDGTPFPILVNGVAIYDEQGNYVMSRSTVFDNSERKQAEQTLRESETQNRLLFEETPDAIVLFDDVGQVARMNRAAEKISGYLSAQVVGRKWDEIDLVAQKYIQTLAAAILQALQQPDHFATVEFQLKRADGEFCDVGARVYGLKIQGRQHYLTTMRDITIEKKVQETLRLANAELARAARTKDEFLANMSHELRTPLNAILGLSESMLDQILGPLDERQAKALQTIEASGRHLLALINDVLDLSKIESGNDTLTMAPVAVKALCESSLIFIKHAALKKQIKVANTLDLAVEWIEADERRLKQMLVNLLSNAVKFTPDGGEIELIVAGDAANKTVSLTVRDTGIGIAPADMARLFKSFVQLDSGLSRRYEGSGLGLALVARMAEMHGGSVSAASEPGKGSRFTIVLPWSETMQTFSGASTDQRNQANPIGLNRSAQPIAEINAQSTHILIAEDNEANIVTLATYLQAKGYRLTLARHGGEALELARAECPALILMDLQMPVLDGLEATRRLRADSNPQLANVPIIALTALAMPGDRERSLAAGANEYLSKPVNLKNLVALIQQLIEDAPGTKHAVV